MKGEIEMLGGSQFHMEHSHEDGAAQSTGGGGDIKMLGGSEFHMGHSPLESAQKRKGMGGIDMVGTQGLIEREGVTPYDSKKPIDKGTE